MTPKKRKKSLETPKSDAPKKLGNPADAISNKNLFLRFRFDRLDVESQWCLSNVAKDNHQKLLRKLGHFESMKVADIFMNGNEIGKIYPTNILIKEAKDRLLQLELDDHDDIHRLRLGGTERLFGFLIKNEFSILWWDPNHQVVPSSKRNT